MGAGRRELASQRRGEAVLAPSPLGLDLAGEAPLGAWCRSSGDEVQDRRIPLVATKAASARDHYRGATLSFREQGGERRLLLDLRAMTTAWRCATAWKDHSPCNWQASARALCRRATRAAWSPRPNLRTRFRSSARFSQLRTDKPYDVPLVCATPSGARITRSRRPIWRAYTGAALCGARGQRCASNWPRRLAAAAGLCVGCRAAHGVACGDAGGPGGRADRVAPSATSTPRRNRARMATWRVKPGKAAWDWWSGRSRA